jgi:hypothetical protein
VTLPAEACLALELNDAGGNGIAGGRLTVRCSGTDLVEIDGNSFTDRATTGLRSGSVVSVSELLEPAVLHMFPNPAVDEVRVQWQDRAGAAELTVFDATGRSVLARALSAGTSSVVLDLAGVDAGLHLLQVRHANGISTGRLIVH